MTNTMGELSALVNDNLTTDFKTSNLIGGDDLLNFFALEILNITGELAVVRALNSPFVESKVAVGLIGWQRKEPTVFKVNGAKVEASTLKGSKYWAKTQYQVLTSQIPNYMLKFLSGMDAMSKLIQMTVGNYSGSIVGRIAAVSKGLTTDTDFTVGNATTEFDSAVIRLVNKKRGNHSKPHLLIMHEETLDDIMNKQQLGTIKTQHITELYRPATTVSTDGTKTTYTAPTNRLDQLTGNGTYGTIAYWYKGTVPVITSNQFPKGYVFFFEKDAFLIGYGSYADMRSRIIEETHSSTGTFELISEMHDCLYLRGSTFKGVQGTNYADEAGVTEAEYEKGGVIGLPEGVPTAYCGLTIAHVKIG